MSFQHYLLSTVVELEINHVWIKFPPSPPPPSISTPVSPLFLFSLSFLPSLLFFFIGGGGGGFNSLGGKALSAPRSPSYPFSFLLPLLSFPFSPFSFSLLFLSSSFFFFFFFLRGGGARPARPPPGSAPAHHTTIPHRRQKHRISPYGLAIFDLRKRIHKLLCFTEMNISIISAMCFMLFSANVNSAVLYSICHPFSSSDQRGGTFRSWRS